MRADLEMGARVEDHFLWHPGSILWSPAFWQRLLFMGSATTHEIQSDTCWQSAAARAYKYVPPFPVHSYLFPFPASATIFCCFHSKCRETRGCYFHAFTVEAKYNVIWTQKCFEKAVLWQHNKRILVSILLCNLYMILPLYCNSISVFWQRFPAFFVHFLQIVWNWEKEVVKGKFVAIPRSEMRWIALYVREWFRSERWFLWSKTSNIAPNCCHERLPGRES